MNQSETVESIEQYRALVGTILKDPWMGSVFTGSLDILKSLCTKELSEQDLEYELDEIEFQINESLRNNPSRHMPMRRLVYALSESINNTARVLISKYGGGPSNESNSGFMDAAVKEEDEKPAHGSNMVQIVPMPNRSGAAIGNQAIPAVVKEELEDALFDNNLTFADESLQMPKLEEEEVGEDEDEDFGTYGGAFDERKQDHSMHRYEYEDESKLFQAFPRPVYGTGTCMVKPSTSAGGADPLAGLVARWQNRQQQRYPAAATLRTQPPPPKRKKKKIVMKGGGSIKAVFQGKDFDYWSGRTASAKCPRCDLEVTRGARKKHYLREHYDYYFMAGSSHVNDIERWMSIRLGRGTTYSKPDIRICLHCTDNRDVYRTRLVLLKHLGKKHPEVFNELVSEYQRMKRVIQDTGLHEKLMNATLIEMPKAPELSSSGRVIIRKNSN